MTWGWTWTRILRPNYTILGKAKVIQELQKAAAGISEIFLGPDPDREGEAIAWHIAEALGEKDHRFKRVLFLELTQAAIREALAIRWRWTGPATNPSRPGGSWTAWWVTRSVHPLAKGQDRPLRRAGAVRGPAVGVRPGTGHPGLRPGGILVPGRLPGRG